MSSDPAKTTLRQLDAELPALERLTQRIDKLGEVLVRHAADIAELKGRAAANADAIARNREFSNEANRTASETRTETRAALDAVSRQLNAIATQQATLVAQQATEASEVGRLTTQFTAFETSQKAIVAENRKQTGTLEKLAGWQNHPALRLTATWFGAAIAAYLAARANVPAPVMVPQHDIVHVEEVPHHETGGDR